VEGERLGGGETDLLVLLHEGMLTGLPAARQSR
jgi:hypothetical protein